MSKKLGIKELVKTGQMAAREALSIVRADCKTAEWLYRRIKAGKGR
jgi:hypothetical protein